MRRVAGSKMHSGEEDGQESPSRYGLPVEYFSINEKNHGLHISPTKNQENPAGSVRAKQLRYGPWGRNLQRRIQASGSECPARRV